MPIQRQPVLRRSTSERKIDDLRYSSTSILQGFDGIEVCFVHIVVAEVARHVTSAARSASHTVKSADILRTLACVSFRLPSAPSRKYFPSSRRVETHSRGSIFHDMLSHDFDTVHFCTNVKIPEEVCAICITVREKCSARH